MDALGGIYAASHAARVPARPAGARLDADAGGHNIPESTIRRRYEAGIHNLFELYIPICDYWMIADNSMSPMEVIAKGFRSDKKEIYNSDIYTKLEHHE